MGIATGHAMCQLVVLMQEIVQTPLPLRARTLHLVRVDVIYEVHCIQSISIYLSICMYSCMHVFVQVQQPLIHVRLYTYVCGCQQT